MKKIAKTLFKQAGTSTAHPSAQELNFMATLLNHAGAVASGIALADSKKLVGIDKTQMGKLASLLVEECRSLFEDWQKLK